LERVAADDVARGGLLHHVKRRIFEEVLALDLDRLRKQRLGFRRERRVLGRESRQAFGAAIRIELEQFVEQRTQRGPALGIDALHDVGGSTGGGERGRRLRKSIAVSMSVPLQSPDGTASPPASRTMLANIHARQVALLRAELRSSLWCSRRRWAVRA